MFHQVLLDMILKTILMLSIDSIKLLYIEAILVPVIIKIIHYVELKISGIIVIVILDY